MTCMSVRYSTYEPFYTSGSYASKMMRDSMAYKGEQICKDVALVNREKEP